GCLSLLFPKVPNEGLNALAILQKKEKLFLFKETSKSHLLPIVCIQKHLKYPIASGGAVEDLNFVGIALHPEFCDAVRFNFQPKKRKIQFFTLFNLCILKVMFIPPTSTRIQELSFDNKRARIFHCQKTICCFHLLKLKEPYQKVQLKRYLLDFFARYGTFLFLSKFNVMLKHEEVAALNVRGQRQIDNPRRAAEQHKEFVTLVQRTEVDTNCMLALLSFEYNSEVKVVIPSIFMFISVLCLDRLLNGSPLVFYISMLHKEFEYEHLFASSIAVSFGIQAWILAYNIYAQILKLKNKIEYTQFIVVFMHSLHVFFLFILGMLLSLFSDYTSKLSLLGHFTMEKVQMFFILVQRVVSPESKKVLLWL
ncbi:hypothetical protein ACJX0J_021237, partial [Zea mays]